jgi:hypothetical protein
MKKIIILVSVASVLSLLGFRSVSGLEATAEIASLTGQDYEEIKALYARYNQGSDFRDTELFLSAFAEDAVMTRDGGDIRGIYELRADRARRYQGQAGDVGRRHFNGSLLISPTVEGASARTYYILYDVAARPRMMISSGYYHDDFVRTANGWRIKHRTLIIDAADE